MMSSQDAAPFDALFQRIHHRRGSIYASKTTDLPPRRRPQHSTLETRGLSNSDNAHARCVEGLHMMSSQDAAPIDALSQRIHHVLRSNYASKTTDLPPRRRPQHSTLETRGLSNSDNAHARCVEGLHMMSSQDAAPIDALSQRIHHVLGSNYASKTTALPPRRRPQHSTLETRGLSKLLLPIDATKSCCRRNPREGTWL